MNYMDSDPSNLAWIVLFLLGSGYFSVIESIFRTLNKVKLRKHLDDHKSISPSLESLTHRSQDIIISSLIGNILSTIAVATVAIPFIKQYIPHIPIPYFAHGLAITCVMVTSLIFGEIIPRTHAIKRPIYLAEKLTPLIKITLFIFKPFIMLSQGITFTLSKIMQLDTNRTKQFLTTEELKTMVTIGEEEGVLEKEEKDMINSIFDFSLTIVKEIMTPRVDTIFIESSKTVEQAIALVIEKGHSRIPVYEDKVDNIIGILYAKDLLKIEDKTDSIKSIIRDAIFIPETKSIEGLLQQMQKSKFLLAIAMDEYGGVSGIVTLEDIIEEIIGEIQDEYDRDKEPEIIKLDKNTYLVDAKMNLDDLYKTINTKFPEDEDYTTLGGFLLSLSSNFPSEGDRFEYKNLELSIGSIKKRRILNVTITKKDTY